MKQPLILGQDLILATSYLTVAPDKDLNHLIDPSPIKCQQALTLFQGVIYKPRAHEGGKGVSQNFTLLHKHYLIYWSLHGRIGSKMSKKTVHVVYGWLSSLLLFFFSAGGPYGLLKCTFCCQGCQVRGQIAKLQVSSSIIFLVSDTFKLVRNAEHVQSRGGRTRWYQMAPLVLMGGLEG